MPHRCIGALVFLAISLQLGFAQPLSVMGVDDRSDNNVNSASFIVPADPGHSYLVLLDGKRVPAGVTNRVFGPDYHEISVWRTNVANGQVTNRLVRFVIMSDRGDPERGLIPWVPFPLIPSASDESSGATLELMVPADYPAGLEIPVVARVNNPSGHARRVNGLVTAPGQPSFRILRGHGSGFLPPGSPGASIQYDGQLGSISASREINIDAATSWTVVSGTLAGNVVWPENSRIHLTGNTTIPSSGTLTIGAGTIVRLNPLVNITNAGRTIINGTLERPVVFTATNRVAPEVHQFAWGGFIMRGSASVFPRLEATGTIFVGGGGDDGFPFPSGADSHRSEQPVLFLFTNATANLTNCAFINTAGQIGNGKDSDLVLDHCLVQKAITTGEYVAGTIIVNHSALIEFPEDNGVVNSSIANADYDAIYFTTGTHLLYNSLIGFCKDDAIDSGSGGAGTVLVTNCWIESALHEANAWSGSGRRAEVYNTVLMNSGQGFECGWSSGNNSPLTYAGALLSIGNSIGARFGDNYEDIGPFNGLLRVTNSFVLHNYRDVWGMTWRSDSTGWFYRSNQMDVRDSFLSQANPFHPNNTIWDGEQHGWRLASFMTTPADAFVGIGFATWTNFFLVTALFDGVPVRLSSFATNTVQVEYSFHSALQTVHTGSITFLPGETVKRIYPYGFDPSTVSNLRLTLNSAVGGELTGNTNIQFSGRAATSVPNPVFGFKSQHDQARIAEGYPLALNAPSGLPYQVGYEYRWAGGILSTGLITFAPGETLAWAAPPEGDLEGIDVVQFVLRYTGIAAVTAYYLKLPPSAALPPSTTLIARGSNWRYPNVAGQLAASWTTAGFNDSAWQEGPSELGFGDGDEARPITRFSGQMTYYFRKTITVSDPTEFVNLSLWMRRDDGAVMYFNGQEVHRSSSMPALPTVITFTTEAVNQGENAEQTATLSTAGLIAGANLVAVEVHQDDPGSSDISFNVELIGNPAPPPARVYVFRYGDQLLVVWFDSLYRLQQADSVTGPWSNVTSATSPFVIQNPAVGQKFYRLAR